MPYVRETAGKGGHADFVRNPDVANFLTNCTYLKQPSDEEAQSVAKLFQAAPRSDPPLLPRVVIASDASKNDTPISDKLPSTQVGFLKVSHVLVDMRKYDNLRAPDTHFVDPFKAAEIHREASPVTFTMPGSNVRYLGEASVRSGFRRALFDQLQSERTRFYQGRTLAEALVDLSGQTLELDKCPSCQGAHRLVFTRQLLSAPCPSCGKDVFATDFLRLHEGISDFGDNASAMTRMMNAMEHLILGAFILHAYEQAPSRLATISFVMDGPLAVFGEPAKLASRLQRLIFKVNEDLRKNGHTPMLILGLQKTGGLMDHAKLIERYVPKGSLRVVDDNYRNTYITGADNVTSNFGNETYYGQDFLFRTESGRMFNFAIPYPMVDKSAGGGAFSVEKVKLSHYGTLIQQACDLIRHFEMDLYESALVPVALAHRHASISLAPGGKVLDIMVRTGLTPTIS